MDNLKPKKGINRPLLFFFLLILLSFSVTADYWQTGGGNRTTDYMGHYRTGDGFFNSELTDFVTYTRSVSDPVMHPLFVDFRGDEQEEIVIIDKNQARMYENISLNILDAYSFTHSASYYRYSFIYDIENEGVPYIISVNEGENTQSKEIVTLKWDGGGLTKDSEFGSGAPSNIEDLQHVMACKNTKDCLVVYAYGLGSGATKLVARWFDHDSVGNEFQIIGGATGTTMTCLPKIRNMVVSDFDNDGIDEYIFSYVQDGTGSLGTNSYYGIVALQVNSSSAIQVDRHITDTDLTEVYDGSNGCINGNYGKTISGVYVDNIDGATSNGKELVMAYMTSDDEFIMKAWRSDGVELDTYPEIFQADGEIISNIMSFNAFPDTGEEDDFCVLGYKNDSAEIDLLCASYITGETPQTREFIIDISNRFNISQEYGAYQAMTHSSQQSAVINDGANFRELVSSYGIHQLDREDVCRIQLGANIFCLDEIFEAPIANGVVLMSDIEEIDRAQMFILTDTNFYGVHDNFVNTPAEIDEYSINPCIDATWKVNTTIEVTITPTDIDTNNVRAKAVLYYSDLGGGSDSGWSSYSISGHTFTFAFEAVNITPSSVLRLYASDDFNTETYDIIDVPFSVGMNGVVYGECQTTITSLAEEDDDDLPTSLENSSLAIDPETGNFIQQNIGELNARSGLGTAVIWLFVMVLVAVLIYWNMQDPAHIRAMMGVQGIVQVILLIMGAKLGFISFGLILTLVVIGVLVAGIWLSRRFVGQGVGGG